MTVPTSYFTSNKNVAGIFAAIQKAAVPDAFTYEFLKALGFASSSDRPVISVMKSIGMLDSSGRPTQVYRDYKDPKIAKTSMAKAVRNGYADVFAIDTDAHARTSNELTGIFNRVSDKGESVTQKMASTFRALVDLADFDNMAVEQDTTTPSTASDMPETTPLRPSQSHTVSLRHDVHVHLPLSTDIAVYDAIFKSLKAHLL